MKSEHVHRSTNERESAIAVLYAIRCARVAYTGLERVNPFEAFRYAESLDKRIGRLLEACEPTESNAMWPLSERLAMYRLDTADTRDNRAMWALERKLPC